MFARIAFALAVVAVELLWPASALAERELIVPFHEPGHLVIQQLSGFRLSPDTGASYAGAAGIAFRSTKLDALDPSRAATDSAETKTTELWLAPSADVFVTEHLSVGGLVEITHTWGAVESGGQRVELPGATSMTFLPRVGFYAPFGDRIGLWPRVGVGFASAESVSFLSTGSAPNRETFRTMLLEVDLTVVYRFTETFFMSAGPEIAASLGGRRTVDDTAGTSAGGGASTIQVSAVTGFGMNLEL